MYLFTYTTSYIWLKISRPAWLVCTTKGRLWGLLTPLLLAWALCFLILYAMEISPPWIKLPWTPCLPFHNGLCPWRLHVKIIVFLTLLLSGSVTAIRGASEINGDGTKKGWDFQLRWKHKSSHCMCGLQVTNTKQLGWGVGAWLHECGQLRFH